MRLCATRDVRIHAVGMRGHDEARKGGRRGEEEVPGALATEVVEAAVAAACG